MRRFFTILAALFVFVGCSQDDVVTPNTPIEKPTYYASFADAEADSRTYLDENFMLLWHNDDRISLFATTYNEEYAFADATGSNSGAFNAVDKDSYVTGNAISTTYAVYPYNAANAISNSEILTIHFPAEQSYAEDSFGRGANTMVAAAQSSSSKLLPFRNAGGYMMLKLYGENKTVKSIELKGNNEEVISGAATAEAKYGYLPLITMGVEGGKTITLTCQNAVELGATEAEATTFWIVVPPITFEEGFTITVTDADGGTYTKSTSKPTTITRNEIKSMSALAPTFTGETENPENTKPAITYDWYTTVTDGIYTIDMPGELVALSKLTNGDAEALAAVGVESAVTFEGMTINLAADIDLSDYCSVLAGNWTPIGTFKGVFNGNNHTISNLYSKTTGDAGLFLYVSGATIKDVTIHGTLISREARYVGGIASEASSTLFENCISAVNITTSTTGFSTCVGGVVGYSSDSKYIACQSTGDISDTIDEREWENFVGGIVGYAMNGGSKFVACMKLSGKVHEEKTQSYSPVGGILGYVQTTYSNVSIRSCYTSISILGREPGHITNNGYYETYSLSADIANCYYSGTPTTSKGIGTRNYGGQHKSFDYGTARSTDIAAEIVIMNEGIDSWNAANAECICNYKYELDANGELKLTKQSQE